jgi:hypothetical protein
VQAGGAPLLPARPQPLTRTPPPLPSSPAPHRCTADCGWITGHSYLTYGPLLVGASQVVFEGVPTYPGADRCWQVVDKYQVRGLGVGLARLGSPGGRQQAAPAAQHLSPAPLSSHLRAHPAHALAPPPPPTPNR